MLIGNLTQPPEFKQLQNGGTVARVKLATNKSWKDRATGERKTAQNIIRVTCGIS